MKICVISKGYDPKIGGGICRHIDMFKDAISKKFDIITDKQKNVGEYKQLFSIFTITPTLPLHLKKEKYILYHVHGYQTFQPFLVSLTKIFTKRPFLFTPHYHPFGKKNKVLRKLFDIFFGIFSIKMADKIIAVTEYEKRLLLKTFKLDPKKIEVIHNPIDPDFLSQKNSKLQEDKLRKKYFLNNRKNILYVGSFSKHKRIDRILGVFNSFQEDCNLILVGGYTGNEYKNVKKIIDQKKIKNVIITGCVDKKNLISIFDLSDVFVLSSEYEAFGLVLIEAMARKCAIVANGVGGIPEVLENGKYGLMFNDDEEFIKQLRLILYDNCLRKKIVRNGKKRVLEYSVKPLQKQLNKIYGELIEKK